MWPYRPSQPQTQPAQDNNTGKETYHYNPSTAPPGFQPPTAHRILSHPTPQNPGYSKYSSSNPFAAPLLPPNHTQMKGPKPSSAFYVPNEYKDHTSAHASPPGPSVLRTTTPAPHLQFRPHFGVRGFEPAGVHELAYKPFPSTQQATQPQSSGIRNRPFGYQSRPAFPGAVHLPTTRAVGSGMAGQVQGRERGMLPREKLLISLERVVEGDVAGEGRGEKRKRSLLPSEKVRKRLQGLGPREAWDPDSP